MVCPDCGSKIGAPLDRAMYKRLTERSAPIKRKYWDWERTDGRVVPVGRSSAFVYKVSLPKELSVRPNFRGTLYSLLSESDAVRLFTSTESSVSLLHAWYVDLQLQQNILPDLPKLALLRGIHWIGKYDGIRIQNTTDERDYENGSFTIFGDEVFDALWIIPGGSNIVSADPAYIDRLFAQGWWKGGEYVPISQAWDPQMQRLVKDWEWWQKVFEGI